MAEGKNEIVGAIGHMKKRGSLRIVLIGLAVGVALLVAGRLGGFDRESEQESAVSEVDRGLDSFWEYKARLEDEIEALCSGVAGVRSANAVAFFDGVGGSIYAQNTQNGNVAKNEYVIVGSGSGAHALYIGESLPKLSGIGVVCDTEGGEAKLNELTVLLSAAYGLPLTRVYVSEG